MDKLSRRSALVALCAASLSPRRAGATVRAGDLLQAVDSRDGAMLRAADLPDGGPAVLAWPVDPASRRPRNGDRYDQLLVFRSGSVVSAYTAVCTHAGCIVGDWDREARLARCPCHGSEYDLARDGAVATGPAPSPLPRLILGSGENGLVVVKGGFDAPVGGHTGRTD